MPYLRRWRPQSKGFLYSECACGVTNTAFIVHAIVQMKRHLCTSAACLFAIDTVMSGKAYATNWLLLSTLAVFHCNTCKATIRSSPPKGVAMMAAGRRETRPNWIPARPTLNHLMISRLCAIDCPTSLACPRHVHRPSPPRESSVCCIRGQSHRDPW
ncbi:uncharacterized protein BDV17DRAFT_270948 [Aspergillus undulatus]|uniref:uncharacterized protein n=1 Tax=Aspergillus undulatus TaxID=1810928 RepID=UPI003CCD6C92